MTELQTARAREAATRRMTGWVAAVGHLAVHPGMDPSLLRAQIAQHVAPIPLPAGDRLEFVTRCISTTFELVDWDRVIADLTGGGPSGPA
jgi:hypothetical protein